MVDTSVVIAGAAALRGAPLHPQTDSGALLLKWIEESHFQWLYTEEILNEYKELLKRFKVRPSIVGQFINLLREEGTASAFEWHPEYRRIQVTILSAPVPRPATRASSSP